MIRLTFVLRRKPDLSREEFQEYWRRQHGPLVAKHRRGSGCSATCRCTRSTIRSTTRWPRRAAAWSRPTTVSPSCGGGAASGSSRRWRSRRRRTRRELLEDERTFIDLERSPLWFAHEYPQVNPVPEDIVARERSPLVKLFFCLRHPAGQSEQDAQVYWRTAHGPIIRSIAQAGGILRYLQVHRVEDELEGALRQARGTTTEPYTGHAELWYDRRAFGNAIPERARGGEMAVADESNFIDFKRSAMWIAKERVFVDVR